MNKSEKYAALLPQVKALCEGETDLIAKMANVSALLHHEFGFWWTGFYRVSPAYGEIQKSKNNTGFIDYSEAGRHELLLGPFQGPIACVHIAYGRGVCGTAWKERRTVVVPDVEEFPGHIACSSESRSEIVVPMFKPAPPTPDPSQGGDEKIASPDPSQGGDEKIASPDPSLGGNKKKTSPVPSLGGDKGVGENNQEVIAVLDIDSRELNTFDDVDARWLEEIVNAMI